jgi:hypothetical protein
MEESLFGYARSDDGTNMECEGFIGEEVVMGGCLTSLLVVDLELCWTFGLAGVSWSF